MQIPLFYRPKALFGLDVGRTTVKIAQLKVARGQPQVIGYGYGRFDKTAAHEGELVKPELIAEVIRDITNQTIIGHITTNRIAASIPIAHSYVRVLKLPSLSQTDLLEAVKLEAEQYVPIPSQELYIEHRVLAAPKAASGAKEKTISVLMVAVPKKIVGSYLALFDLLKLEVASIEPNMFANLRAIDFNCQTQGAKIVIDFGAHSSDMAIYDNGVVKLTSTVATGGDHITATIAKALNLTYEQATQLKIHYGIAKSRWQAQLATALQPILSDFASEVQKMMRYFHEHTPQAAIDQIVVVGGGANMPGLSDFLSHLTGVGVLVCNPWTNLVLKPLQPPNPAETTIFATAVGLALKELDKS
ncbi:type IV pilus assembly protein PilM [Candidatus Microgenomates bacterium]|nr:type IV pilus assembly protein PilM [Candidatus Microgenomates bacterium]